MPQPANPVLRILHRYIFWTYERGSFHYDVMVTVILLFLFLSPRVIDFKDKPVQTVALHASEVLVREAGTSLAGTSRFIYESAPKTLTRQQPHSAIPPPPKPAFAPPSSRPSNPSQAKSPSSVQSPFSTPTEKPSPTRSGSSDRLRQLPGADALAPGPSAPLRLSIRSPRMIRIVLAATFALTAPLLAQSPDRLATVPAPDG